MNSHERRRARRRRHALSETIKGNLIATKESKNSKPDTSQQKESRTKPHKAALALLLALCTLLGGLVAILGLLPRVAVSTPSLPIDPGNPFSVSFDITNANIVPLRDVEVSVGVGNIIVGPGGQAFTIGSSSDTERGFIGAEAWKHHLLNADDRFTVNLLDLKALAGAMKYNRLIQADITIAVAFNPWLFPVRRISQFRFVTQPRGDAIDWRSWPLNDAPPG